MKLYATIMSEQGVAKKGGDAFLEIILQDKNKKKLYRIHFMEYSKTPEKHGHFLQVYKGVERIWADFTELKHELKIISLYDASAECRYCGWYYSFTGERTKKDIKTEYEKHVTN